MSEKDQVQVASGRRGALKRWRTPPDGLPPRILRLDTLSPAQRRVIAALLSMQAAEPDAARASADSK